MKFIFTATLAFLITFTTLTTTAATTILAGGCFWCMESDFEKVHGVSDVISGFLGGTAENPTYSGDHSGHYEAVKITYDPKLVSYQQLLEHFWVNIDPFDDKESFHRESFKKIATTKRLFIRLNQMGATIKL